MKKLISNLLAVIVFMGVSVSVYAEDTSLRRNRITEVYYSESGVAEIPTAPNYTTTVEFSAKETVQTVVSGDTTGWQVVPQGSRLFIKQNFTPAKKTVKKTNLTIITDKRNYYMNLYSASPDQAAFVVRYRYDDPPKPAPSLPPPPKEEPKKIEPLKVEEPTIDPNYLNSNYSFSGSDEIGLSALYDDGKSTYFEFKPVRGAKGKYISDGIANIFIVNKEGYEVPVDVRTQGKRIVVPLVGKLFSLRRGEEQLCVFNQSTHSVYKAK